MAGADNDPYADERWSFRLIRIWKLVFRDDLLQRQIGLLQIHPTGINIYLDQRLKELGLGSMRRVLGFSYCRCSMFESKFFRLE